MREPLPEVASVLRAAGWSPGGADDRDVRRWLEWIDGQGYPSVAPLGPALEAYGGLKVEVSGFGLNAWRESFELEPTKTGSEEDRISDWAADLGTALAPLGLVGHGNGFLVIGADGSVFAIQMNISLVGADITDAIENLVLGRRGARIGQT